jgi:hypothetical protein
MGVDPPTEPIGIACLDLTYSISLSRAASEKARQEENRKLDEEEARRSLRYSSSTSDSCALNDGNHQGMCWMHIITINSMLL